MKNYQDTETGQIWAFEDGENPFTMNNRNIPPTLSETVIPKPSDTHVWHNGRWIEDSEKPIGYEPPISSVPIYNPAWISFLFPLGTIILPDEEDMFKITLEQINANTYHSEKFSEIVTTLPIPNSSNNLPFLICYDGAIAIPINEIHPSKELAVDTVNRIIGAIFLGGIFIEAIDYRKIEVGSLLEGGKNVFSYIPSNHNNLRNHWASITDRLVLTHPNIIYVSKLQNAYNVGNKLLDAINSFSPVFLLRGYFALQNWNLSDALNNLWIVVEQLTSFVWKHKFLVQTTQPTKMKNRLDSLKNDNNTWSIAVKHELLWQTKFLSEDCYDKLSSARTLRNNLVHRGKVPDHITVENLWIALFELFETASGISLKELRQLTTYLENETSENLIFLRHTSSDYKNSNLPPKTNFDEWPVS